MMRFFTVKSPLRCLLASAPLSSVAMQHEELSAAALHLQTRFADSDPGPAAALSPNLVIARTSSDGLAGSDPVLAQGAGGILHPRPPRWRSRVKRIAPTANLNRRTLERRLLSVLRRSVHDEIHRIRVQGGMKLLAAG